MMPPPKITEKLIRREMLGFMGIATAAAAAAGLRQIEQARSDGDQHARRDIDGSGDISRSEGHASIERRVVRRQPGDDGGPLLRRRDAPALGHHDGPVERGGVGGHAAEAHDQRAERRRSGTCTPLTGAHVDIWHCDAGVQFATIYPGWYTGRAVHIHIKVRTDPSSQQGYEFTSQLFFDDSLSDQLFAQAPYNTRGARDTRNANDSVYSGGGAPMLPVMTPEGSGYAGTISIGVQTG